MYGCVKAISVSVSVTLRCVKLIVNGHFIELVSLEAKNHSFSVSLVAYLRVNYQIVGSL